MDRVIEFLNIPSEVLDILNKMPSNVLGERQDEIVKKYTEPENFEEATTFILETLKENDEKGFKQLKIIVEASKITYQNYQKFNIKDEIFIDTFKFISSALEVHKNLHGKYGFPHTNWVGRELSCLLFRLGELEYEMFKLDEKPAISIHIPRNANLSDTALDLTFSYAKEFFSKYFPKYSNVPYFCESWLMSPNLKYVLPETSKILGFQKRFELKEFVEDGIGYKFFIFHNLDLKPEEFTENTSLERNIKKYVLSGGKIGHAISVLK